MSKISFRLRVGFRKYEILQSRERERAQPAPPLRRPCRSTCIHTFRHGLNRVARTHRATYTISPASRAGKMGVEFYHPSLYIRKIARFSSRFSTTTMEKKKKKKHTTVRHNDRRRITFRFFAILRYNIEAVQVCISRRGKKKKKGYKNERRWRTGRESLCVLKKTCPKSYRIDYPPVSYFYI